MTLAAPRGEGTEKTLRDEKEALRKRVAELEAEVSRLRAKDQDALSQELRQSRAEFNALLSNLAAGIAMINIKGVITQVNDKFADMIGAPPGEIIGSPLMSLTHPEDVDHSMDRIVALRDGHIDSYSVEKRYMRRKGGYFWAEACVTGVRAEDGSLEGLIGVIIDITERKQVEESLRRSQGYLEALFTHLASGVALVDQHGRIIRHNTKFSEMLGYDPGQLVGITLEEITHPADRSRSTTNLRQIITEQVQCYTIEKRYERKDGSFFWAEASVTQIFGPNGEAQEYVGVITDIDRRKRDECKLREAYESEATLSRTDALTGLGNRQRYNEAIKEKWGSDFACDGRPSSAQPLSLIMIDIDHFKRINDTQGHPAGDTCLQALAGALDKQLRDDVFCRVGGEEFAVLLDGATLQEAQAVAERLRRAMERLDIVHIDPQGRRVGLKITISLGVATVDAADPDSSPESLFFDADQALYTAKQNRRNRVECCTEN